MPPAATAEFDVTGEGGAREAVSNRQMKQTRIYMYTVIAAHICVCVRLFLCLCLCVWVSVCAAFPLGYFPGTTFHGTDKAAMAAASAAAAAAAAFADSACVAAAAGVAVCADSELGNTSGHSDGAESRYRERKRESASE